ncbi:MAG: hypothetical protein N4A49_15400 [Marinifilaceae bacterium]|jgi:sugar O-acyltransferase (sialic acid O-acetyltransferase NeuD family)|nr:hypothetical protein [Marinifilaceae bacterium]
MENNREILIIGCGEHARTVIDNIEQQNKYKIHGLVTNDINELHAKIHNYNVVCLEENLDNYLCDHPYITRYFLGVGVSSGDMKLRQKIYSKLDLILESVNIIHPTAIISKYAKLGKGNLFEAYSKVANDVTIGNHCIVYSFTAINHDQEIGDNVLIGCNVSMAGKNVGSHTIISDGSSISFKKSVGSNTIIGDGTLITKNIPDNVICYGNPAKIIRNNE